MCNGKISMPLLTLCSMLIASGPVADTLECEGIAAETVSELKAGAKDWWTEDTARMASMAAASACFKTLARLEATDDSAQSEADTQDPGEESTEFMGMEVRPLSGPPSRKPYERTRD